MQAVKLDPYFSTGFTFLGHYYREIKHDHSRAKKCYQKAYILNPLDTDAALHLSDYLISEDKQDEAESIFRQVNESNPKVGWAWRRMGYVNMVSLYKFLLFNLFFLYNNIAIIRTQLRTTKPLFVFKRHYVLTQVMYVVGKGLQKLTLEQVDLWLP